MLIHIDLYNTQQKHIILSLFFLFIVSYNSSYAQHTIRILDKEKIIHYPQKKYIVNTKDHEKKRLSVTLLHDYNEEEKRKLAYDIYIMDKKNVQIGYLPFLVGLATNHKEREIKGAEVFINNDTTILSIPFIKCYKYEYGDRRGSSCYCLNLKRGKYFLYATYRDKGETYYSDTILLYVKISLANLSVKTKNDKKTIKRERTIANILFIN